MADSDNDTEVTFRAASPLTHDSTPTPPIDTDVVLNRVLAALETFSSNVTDLDARLRTLELNQARLFLQVIKSPELLHDIRTATETVASTAPDLPDCRVWSHSPTMNPGCTTVGSAVITHPVILGTRPTAPPTLVNLPPPLSFNSAAKAGAQSFPATRNPFESYYQDGRDAHARDLHATMLLKYGRTAMSARCLMMLYASFWLVENNVVFIRISNHFRL